MGFRIYGCKFIYSTHFNTTALRISTKKLACIYDQLCTLDDKFSDVGIIIYYSITDAAL